MEFSFIRAQIGLKRLQLESPGSDCFRVEGIYLFIYFGSGYGSTGFLFFSFRGRIVFQVDFKWNFHVLVKLRFHGHYFVLDRLDYDWMDFVSVCPDRINIDFSFNFMLLNSDCDGHYLVI